MTLLICWKVQLTKWYKQGSLDGFESKVSLFFILYWTGQTQTIESYSNHHILGMKTDELDYIQRIAAEEIGSCKEKYIKKWVCLAQEAKTIGRNDNCLLVSEGLFCGRQVRIVQSYYRQGEMGLNNFIWNHGVCVWGGNPTVGAAALQGVMVMVTVLEEFKQKPDGHKKCCNINSPMAIALIYHAIVLYGTF